MAINFPTSASLNDTYTFNSKTWKWNGTAWEKSSSTETGNTEGNTGEVAYYDTVGSVIKGATAFKYDDSTGEVHFYQGISADKGATFGGAVTAPIFVGALTGNVTGNVTGNASGTSSTVTTAAQPNITSVGTLTSLQTSGGLSADAGATFGGPVNITNAGDAVLTLYADSDNAGGENDNPHINFKQDAGANTFQMGMAGLAGSYFTNSIADRPYINSYWGMQVATANTARVSVDSTGLVHLYQGLSADAGATFGGDVTFQGNLLLSDDGYVGIGGDTEKISFNGSGSGSSSIDIQGAVIDFGLGSGCALRSHGDIDTQLKFENDMHGGGNDGLQLVQSGNVMIDVRPTDVNVAGVTFGGGGATFGGPVNATTFVGALTGNVTGNVSGSSSTTTTAAVATTVTITDNENENESNAIIFTAGGDIDGGNLGLESDGTLTYNPSTGKVTATGFVGALTGNVTGNASGTSATVTTAAQGAITSVGTLTALTMGGELSCVDNLVTRPVLKDYSETVNVIGTITSATTISAEDGNIQTVTVGGNCEFDFDNFPASGGAGTVTLVITNGGAYTTTWDSLVKWPGDNAPALTSSGIDIISFMTIDAGTNIYGFVGGINFS